jgi:putative heme-binding domain-containing protein
LMTVIAGGATDERLFQTVRKGVPGTEMPPSSMLDAQIFQILAYLRNSGAVVSADRVTGNVEHGQQLFSSQCTSCHRVAGKGGRIGPDLTRVGSARSRAALIREIRSPSEVIPPQYDTVTLVTKDGQRIRGTKKNEDTFSIQIMDQRERIQGYLKSDLQEVIYETNSLMPAFPPERLNDTDLNDLVGYLSTLRGVSVDIPMQPVQ